MVNNLRIYSDFNLAQKDKNSIILIGNFDGLHSGHQKLFKEANIIKKKLKVKVGVLTFDPIPKMFFNKDIRNYRISNFSQKKKYFQKYKIDFLINKSFNKRFSKITCYKFIENIIYKKLRAKYIFVSNNFRFGFKREGDVNLLKKYQYKYKFILINPKPLRKNRKIISSTLIRKLLISGKLKQANFLLSRNWEVEGIVQKGRQLGKQIGFPTCNIDLGNYVIAKPGVYAVKVKIQKTQMYFKGIANLGYRPTFNQKKILLEVNLFNFKGNLYDKKLSVEFIKFIRGEKKFNGIDQLRNQIKRDIKLAKKS
tara:strand:+ start:1628 stop:2557 length:930 start_codon:yes stop_codon:yes gene_type:complete